jgi:N6-L-threonylcarbamoyladenine synthase
MAKQYTILGIESSCDETAASVYKPEEGIVSSVLYSQVDEQALYGGVVPEIASRTHLQKIDTIVAQALQAGNVTLHDIDVVAVTSKPGLPGSLLIGLSFAKGIAYAGSKKIIGIDHLEGHVFSSCIEHNVPFPHLCLTVSGGHTSLYLVHDFGKFKMIGTTRDDAGGEALDKSAKLMGLPYPGGPIIEKLAQQAGFKKFVNYPHGLSGSLDFSFSGLKTAVMYDLVRRGVYDMKTKQFAGDETVQREVASSLLVAVKETFIEKLKLAIEKYPHVQAITFVGGVACNQYLKDELRSWAESHNKEFYTPAKKYCTDNAAMIAYVGAYKSERGEFDDLSLDIF